MHDRLTGAAGALLFIADAAVVAGSFVAAFLAKKYGVLADPELEIEPYRGLLAVEAPFILAVLVLHGLYAPRVLLSGLAAQARAILSASLVAFAAFIVVSFYVKMFSYSRAVFTLYFLFLPAGLLAPRLALAGAKRIFGRAPGGVKRLLIFGDSVFARVLADRFAASPYCRIEIAYAGLVGDRPRPEDLARVAQGEVDCVVVDLPFERARAIAEVVERAESEGVSAYLTQRALPVERLLLSREMVGGLPLIALRPPALPPVGRTAKRALDIALSAAGLVGLAPALALLASLVKLTSRGPVLIAQTRVGLDGRAFTMFKFRTMRADAEDETGPVWARPDDERCTPVGRVLRRLHLDELPQLLNVFCGTMSLVGPRPERPEFVGRFKQEIASYPRRHWVRPGITGWAQVNGWTGSTRLDERIRHDLYYIERWSLWLDVRILFMTLFVCLRKGRPPEAPSAAQRTLSRRRADVA